VRKRSLVSCLIVLAAGFTILSLSACGQTGTGASGEASDTPHRVVIEGDVAGGFTRIENTQQSTALDALPDDKNFHGMTLSDFLAAASPAGTPLDVYFMSADGFVAKVTYADADEIYVIYNEDKGFCIIAPNHPISAQARELSRFVVVSEDSDVGLNLVKADGSSLLLSKGQMLVSPLRTALRFQGSSEMRNGDQIRSSSVYTKELSARLGDLYGDYEGEPIVVVTKNNDKYLTDGTGYVIIGEQRFDYQESLSNGEAGDTYEDIIEIQLR
jgi:hypothetical protein